MHSAPRCPGEHCLNALWVLVYVWRLPSGNPHQIFPMTALHMTVPCHREQSKAAGSGLICGQGSCDKAASA